MPEGINDNFLSAEVDLGEWTSRWQAESREVCANRDAIVEAMGIKKGSRLLDVGAGTGLFVAPFSKAVGTRGSVTPVDIAPRFVQHLTERCEQEGFANVAPAQSSERSVQQVPHSMDIAFLCDAYHHFEYYEDMLRSLHQAIRSGGEMTVIDFQRIPEVSTEWILEHVRAGKDQVLSEIQAAGFAFQEQIHLPGLQENYFVRFRRP